MKYALIKSKEPKNKNNPKKADFLLTNGKSAYIILIAFAKGYYVQKSEVEKIVS